MTDLGDLTNLSFRETYIKAAKTFALSSCKTATAQVSRPLDALVVRSYDFYEWIEVPEGTTDVKIKVGNRSLKFKATGGRIEWNIPLTRARNPLISVEFIGTTSNSTRAGIGFYDDVTRGIVSQETKDIVTEIKHESKVVGKLIVTGTRASLKPSRS
jgi:hypothetical protein